MLYFSLLLNCWVHLKFGGETAWDCWKAKNKNFKRRFATFRSKARNDGWWTGIRHRAQIKLSSSYRVDRSSLRVSATRPLHTQFSIHAERWSILSRGWRNYLKQHYSRMIFSSWIKADIFFSSVGQRPKDQTHLLQRQGLPQAHPTQGHPIQGRKGTIIARRVEID